MLILVGAYMARVANKRYHQDHVDHAMVLVNQVAPCSTNEHLMVDCIGYHLVAALDRTCSCHRQRLSSIAKTFFVLMQ